MQCNCNICWFIVALKPSWQNKIIHCFSSHLSLSKSQHHVGNNWNILFLNLIFTKAKKNKERESPSQDTINAQSLYIWLLFPAFRWSSKSLFIAVMAEPIFTRGHCILHQRGADREVLEGNWQFYYSYYLFTLNIALWVNA